MQSCRRSSRGRIKVPTFQLLWTRRTCCRPNSWQASVIFSGCGQLAEAENAKLLILCMLPSAWTRMTPRLAK
ncbi:unnamed protein product, partial [Symbiodinium necroappetens]